MRRLTLVAAILCVFVGAAPARALGPDGDGGPGVVWGFAVDKYGFPAVNACVTLTDWVPSWWTDVARDGTFVLDGLQPSDTYVVGFEDPAWCGAGEFATEFYPDKADRSEGQPLSVVDASTPPIVAVLERVDGRGGGPPSISGTVTDEAGSPLVDMCVEAIGSPTASGPPPSVFGTTDAAGGYSITGLKPDTYKVRFSDCALRVFASETYDDTVAISPAQGTPVPLQAGQAVTGIDAELAPFAAEIQRGPRRATSDRTPRFRFGANSPDAIMLRCAVDSRPARQCRSPLTLPRQTRGRHKFTVTAVGDERQVSRPVRARFTVRPKR